MSLCKGDGMKRCICLLLSFFACFSYGWGAQRETDTPKRFHYDMHVDGVFAFVRGSDFAPGGGLSFGVKGNVYGAELYGLTEIMQEPAGSKTGRNAVGEFLIEGGLRFVWNLFSSERIASSFTLDAGFYAQHVSLPSSPNDYYRMHNGIMIRPAVGTVISKGRFYQLEIAVGYQKTLFPTYGDYDGVVIFAKLF